MTVLVGIRCRDGIVIGSDSAATFAAGQLRTIEQPIKKVAVIADKIIVAGTGEVGLGQRFCAIVKASWESKEFRGEAVHVGRNLCSKAVQDFQSTGADKGSYGALVAFPIGHAFELVEFATTNFQPEVKTADLWYVSMGSGQPIADPCLAFIRQAFWADGMPGVEDGVFAVVWTLQQAIKLNPGGINEPMQIATLQMNGREGAARMLSDAEIAEHVANVDGAIEHLRQYRTQVSGANAPDVPPPPGSA